MNPIIRNILAIIIGLAVGMAINLGLTITGHSVFPIDGLGRWKDCSKNEVERVSYFSTTTLIDAISK